MGKGVTKNALISLLHLSHEMMAQNKGEVSVASLFSPQVSDKNNIFLCSIRSRTSSPSGLWGTRLPRRTPARRSWAWPGSSRSGWTGIRRCWKKKVFYALTFLNAHGQVHLGRRVAVFHSPCNSRWQTFHLSRMYVAFFLVLFCFVYLQMPEILWQSKNPNEFFKNSRGKKMGGKKKSRGI